MTAAGFVGAYPEGLGNLARLSRESSRHIRRVAVVVTGLAARCGEASAAEIARHLHLAAEAVAEAAESLERRAGAIQTAQEVTTHGYVGQHRYLYGLTHFATYAVFDRASRSESFSEWNGPPHIVAFLGMSPRQVEAAFSRLAPSVGTDLADRYPGIVGRLDGIPPQLRYRANRVLIHRHLCELEAELSRLPEVKPLSWVDWIDPGRLVPALRRRADADAAIERLRRQVIEYRRWLDEGRQILLFDPRGDGRLVEVFGDLDRADRIAVVVPGIGNDKTNFSSAADGGFRSNAAALYEAAAAMGPGIATIAWLGYDTPDGIDAGLRGAAESGAPALQRFVEGIDPRAQTQVTVVAHSYGSLVAGLAAAEGLAADDLVFVGSPGTGLDGATDARLRPGGRVWVGLAAGDPIVAASVSVESPPWWVTAACIPPWSSVGVCNGPQELWHGANPADDDFGAVRFSTEGTSGHSGYFEAGSLENHVRIMQGLYVDVDLVG